MKTMNDLENLIKERGYNLRSFSAYIDVPLDVLIDLAAFYKCTTDELLGSGYYYAVIRDAK